MSAPVTRRRALAASAAAALGLGTAACSPAKGHAAASPALSPRDARLVALADAYEALEREVDATDEDAPGYGALVVHFSTLEAEVAQTPADSVAGIVAKARMCQVPTARWCAENDHVLSTVDDVHRLLGGRHA